VLLAISIGLAIGLIGGLLNGVLVAYLGVLAFIVTLGMAQVFTALARYSVNGQPVYGLAEPGFVSVARGATFEVSNKIWIALGFCVVAWLLLDHTTLGRKMYAVGGNVTAAYLAGINTKRIRLIAFAVAGIGAAAGGLLQAASTATANSTAPQPWMLQSIAGVFLGMAMFRNGRPNLWGSVLGVILLRTLDNGLNFTNLNDYIQSAITGVAIVLAVLPPALARLRAQR
jgi:ribose transport system permease protein